MRERSPLSISEAPASRSPGGTPSFTRQEKREIFKAMVVGELDAGFLRYSRRQALLRYAARLGIGEFEACLLIAEAQYKSDEIEPVSLSAEATLESLTRPEVWTLSTRLAFCLVTAIWIDLLLIWWLFGRG